MPGGQRLPLDGRMAPSGKKIAQVHRFRQSRGDGERARRRDCAGKPLAARASSGSPGGLKAGRSFFDGGASLALPVPRENRTPFPLQYCRRMVKRRRTNVLGKQRNPSPRLAQSFGVVPLLGLELRIRAHPVERDTWTKRTRILTQPRP